MRNILITIVLSSVCFYALGQTTPRAGGSKERVTMVVEKEVNTIEVEKPKCVPSNAFGLDLGLGAMYDNDWFGIEESPAFTFAFGFRYLHHFLPYFGVDFFKFNNKLSFKNGFSYAPDVFYFDYNPQLMTGIRGNTPVFAKCMSGYGAFRLGIGASIESISDDDIDLSFFGIGFCYELEIGLNLTRTVFIAYSYNHQGGTRTDNDSDYDYPLNMNYHAFRIGFNFGK